MGRDQIGFVVGPGLVPEFLAVIGNGAGTVVSFPHIESEDNVHVLDDRG